MLSVKFPKPNFMTCGSCEVRRVNTYKRTNGSRAHVLVVSGPPAPQHALSGTNRRVVCHSQRLAHDAPISKNGRLLDRMYSKIPRRALSSRKSMFLRVSAVPRFLSCRHSSSPMLQTKRLSPFRLLYLFVARSIPGGNPHSDIIPSAIVP